MTLPTCKSTIGYCTSFLFVSVVVLFIKCFITDKQIVVFFFSEILKFPSTRLKKFFGMILKKKNPFFYTDFL
jgi:hypothetical protein